MGKVSKISVALTSEMASMVEEAVRSGSYATSSEVIREALREWRDRRGTAELRALWTEGLASGPGRFEDMETLKAEARARLARRGGD